MTDNGVLIQYNEPETTAYSADADIAWAPLGAAVLPDDLVSIEGRAGEQAICQADSVPPVGPSTPLDFVTTEVLDRAFFGPVVGPCPEFGMPGACTLSDTLSREDGTGVPAHQARRSMAVDIAAHCLDWENTARQPPLRRSPGVGA